MRHTGKTTRLVDEAIQYLFTYGRILIPTKGYIHSPEALRGLTQSEKECIVHFIDPDSSPENNAQTHFIVTFRRRLYGEHDREKIIEKKRDVISFSIKQ